MSHVKMKVIYLMHSSSKYEGSSKSLLSLLDGLKEKGIEPYVVLPKRKNMTMIEELNNRCIPFSVVSFVMPLAPTLNNYVDYITYVPKRIKNFLVNAFCELQIHNIIKRIKPSIIHSNAGPMILGYSLAKKTKIPHVWHLREYQDLDFNLNTLYSMNEFRDWLLDPLNHPVAISKDIFNHFALKQNAKMIYNGIRKSSERQLIEVKEKYFLYVGGLNRAKGIKELIATYAIFFRNNQGYKLYIAGDTSDSSYKQSLIEFTKENGIDGAVSFLGLRDDINNLMGHAIALIVPSIKEAFGRITAEAAFNGCLVIGNNSGGTKEIIELLNCGILYNGSEGLLAALNSISNTGIATHLNSIRKGQEKAVEFFSYEQNAKSVFTLYNEILRPKKN